MATVKISALPESTLTNDMALAGVEGGVTKKMSGSIGSPQIITALGFTPANINSPAFTGTPTTTTPGAGDSSTRIANTAWVNLQGYVTATSAPVTSVAGKTGAVILVVGDVGGAAPLASPALTGVPTAPTAAPGTNTTQIATTAFVTAAGFQGGIQWQNQGSNVGTPGSELTVNFTGGGVTASIVGSVLTVSVPSGSGGTVTSVGLSLPSELTVSGSPVINSGTLSAVWASQAFGKVFASPPFVAGAPAFISLTYQHFPVSGVSAGTYGTTQGIPQFTVNAQGVVTTASTLIPNVTGMGAAKTAVINTYATAGSFTWNKPANAVMVYVMCIGGGGGGGAGAKQSATTCTGGGGGGGGGKAEGWFDASLLGASVTVTVGVGGVGAAGQTTANANGAAGGNGGSSSFGTFITGFAGGGGAGGSALNGCGGGGAGGGGNGNVGSNSPGTGGRGGGVDGGPNTGGVSAQAGGDSTGLGGGGGGGSALGSQGGRGGDSYAGGSGGGAGGGGGNAASGAPGGQGGAANRQTIASNGTGGTTGTAGTAGTTPTSWAAGPGGGGGGAGNTGVGGAGGDGADHGGGGGGGGTTSSGSTSGKGGDGGQGFVAVVTFF